MKKFIELLLMFLYLFFAVFLFFLLLFFVMIGFIILILKLFPMLLENTTLCTILFIPVCIAYIILISKVFVKINNKILPQNYKELIKKYLLWSVLLFMWWYICAVFKIVCPIIYHKTSILLFLFTNLVVNVCCHFWELLIVWYLVFFVPLWYLFEVLVYTD